MAKEVNPIKDYQKLVQKVDDAKKKNPLDLSSDQDLSIAIMNLISIEEHFFFTAEKTEKEDEYLDLLQEVRSMRTSLLKNIIQDYEGEVWCISKHLLASSMRLIEVGTKQYSMGKKEEAKSFFQKAYDLYSLFWGLNMKIIGTNNIKKIDDKAIDKKDKEKTGLMGKLGAVVKKAVDCCIE